MRLDRLTVKGLFTFREAVTLDASTLPRGVVAIVGPNGEGKTGLIECAIAALHRQFPTREKDLSYYTNQREAYIEADYTLDTPYRARVNIDGQTHKSAATLSAWIAGGWRPLNDGKVSTYAPEVDRRFPSLPVLLATAFAAQNRRGSFSDLSARERKELFQELLGLGQYEAWSIAALELVRAVEKRKAALEVLGARLAAETAPALAAALEADGQRLQVELTDAGAWLERLVRDVADARQAAAAAVDEQHAVAGRVAERTRLQEQQRGAEADVTRLEADLVLEHGVYQTANRAQAGRLETLLERLLEQGRRLPTDEALDAGHEARVGDARTTHSVARADREARLANNRDILARAAEIKAAGAALAQLEATRDQQRRTLADAQAAVDQGNRERDAAQQAVHDLDVSRTLETARASAALIDRVPFGAKCAEAACAFVRQAAEARASIPALEATQRRCDEAQPRLARAVEAFRIARAALSAADVALYDTEAAILDHDRNKTRDRVARLATAQDRADELAKDLEALDVELTKAIAISSLTATSAKAIAAEQRQQLEADRADFLADAERAAAALQAEHVGRLDGIKARRAEALQRVQTAERALEQLAGQAAADAGAADRAAAAIAQLAQREAEQRAAVEMRARLTAEAAAARARVDDFQRRRVELEAVQAALVALDRELVEWSFLAAATSRDGLPTLEIDAAGPLVSERANDLLATCYGSQRFTIEIVTQDARAKGGLKEVFEMKVWDATDSRHARDIGDLSGGEKILVDEAVKCALALHVNDHSRIAIRTCFRDETTSALYPDTALRYMTMLRRVHERGGFDHVFFVTHNPAVAAEADAQILVQGGRLTVTLPPYDAITWPQTAEATA